MEIEGQARAANTKSTDSVPPPSAVRQREPGLRPRLVDVSDGEARRLLATVEERFADPSKAGALWERFRSPCVARVFGARKASALLPLVVPDRFDDLVLVITKTAGVARGVTGYRGAIGALVALLGDQPADEYCVVPATVDWVLCENELGVLMAAGPCVEARLAAL